VIRSGISGDFPLSFAETPSGLLLMANGIDPMMKWDGLVANAPNAGVTPPSTAMQLGGVGSGYITGTLAAYQRFVDDHGNVSDLSPISNLVVAGMDGLIESVNYSKATGLVTMVSFSHGLASGERIMIDGVQGISLVNGSFVITVVDQDTFTINGLINTQGVYSQGGAWTLGVMSLIYGAVPVSTQANVVRRQILRNLSGNADAVYVDIDTTDLISTAFASTLTDNLLCANEPVPMFSEENGLPFASRHGVPPSHKSVLALHKGRVFATAETPYDDGHVEAAFNSVFVHGVGTAWPANFAGRCIYINGANSRYLIDSVDPINQILTLDSPFLQPPAPYALYTILPDPGERRLVYYSEAGLVECWPAFNAIAVPENNDSIVGMVTLESYLYIIERRHIHRLTFDKDPASDGFLFRSVNRGSLNNRTYASVEDAIYFLDEIGIHKFDGQETKPVSGPIQTVFQQDETSDISIDWTSDQSIWHAAADPVRDTIRWFVTMVGFSAPYHAISYNYRTDRWWIEQYPTPMTASCNATIGHRRSLAGTDARRVVCLSEGVYDGVVGVGTLRGSPTLADADSLTDSSASFDAIEGAPISIVDGTGIGQTRIIASVSTNANTIFIIQPWTVIPDATSVYQVGGIPWNWQSGWFQYVEDEEDNCRDIELVFRPVKVPTLLDMQLFFDHSFVPRNWSRSLIQDNVQTEAGLPQITVQLAAAVGWARQQYSGHANRGAYGDRFVSVSLSGVQAGEPVRVSQVVINGVEAV